MLLGIGYFLNIDKELYLALLPMATVGILLIWLFINKIKLVKNERSIGWLAAFLFTSACFMTMIVLGYAYYEFANKPETFRIFLWIFYGVAVLGLSEFGASRSLIRTFKKIF